MIRTKSGCVTCRIRRVKCDEARPNCQKCTSTGRKCDGYASHPLRLPRRIAEEKSLPKFDAIQQGSAAKSRTVVLLPAPSHLSLNSFFDENEARSFEVYCSNSDPHTNRLVESEFWSQLVPQIAQEEPSVRFSILCIGALQRKIELEQTKEESKAIIYYTRAVREAQDLVARSAQSKDYAKVLVCAILFHCIENKLGDHVSAKAHLRSGLSLLQKHPLPNSHLDGIIARTYQRFDFQAMTFWDDTAPYEFRDTIETRLNQRLLPNAFTSLNESATCLMDLMQRISYIQESNGGRFLPEPNISRQSQLDDCSSSIDDWFDCFEDFKTRYGSHATEFRQTCRLLSMYYLMAFMHIRRTLSEPEMQWDEMLPRFAELLDLADSFIAAESTVFTRGVVSLELGIIVPLFETAMRCRDPIQRRRAIQMLRSAPRQEGVWDSLGAATVAECVMNIEEDGLGEVSQTSDVPDEQRIYFLNPAANVRKREIHATFFSQRCLKTSTSGDLYYEWKTQQRLLQF